MKNYSLILGFMAVLLGFPGGSAYADQELAQEKQKSRVLLKPVQSQNKTINTEQGRKKNTDKTADARQDKAQETGRAKAASNGIENENGQQKPLDLSIPFKTIDEAGWKNAKAQVAAEIRTSNLFASENKKSRRQVNLDGGVLMSQEPETEKQRSLDGAGIRLNLKH